MCGLQREGFRHVFTLTDPDQAAGAELVREPLYNNKRNEHGPLDIIGDVHGCNLELTAMLTKLGYRIERPGRDIKVSHPEGRRAIFVGDLVDRGPDSPDVLYIVMRMVADGTAYCVPGNHDMTLLRKLTGRDVQVTHGLAETMAQLRNTTQVFQADIRTFLDGLVSHYVFDDGKLVVAHAGMKEEMQGRGSGKVREFALYGETTGETDEFGVEDEGIGICVTRTGRRFFDDGGMEQALLASIRESMGSSGLWDEFDTDWICLDCELMPWSAKALRLIQQQYAAVGAAANAALGPVVEMLRRATERCPETAELRDRYIEKQENAGLFVDAYRRYCRLVESIADLKLAPFHILATEHGVHTGQPHPWHMKQIYRLCAASAGLLLATPYRTVNVTEPESMAHGIAWWEELTGKGGEGIVVKPIDFVVRGTRGITQASSSAVPVLRETPRV